MLKHQGAVFDQYSIRMQTDAKLPHYIVVALEERQAWQKQISVPPKEGAEAETLLENLNQYLKLRETTMEPHEHWDADERGAKGDKKPSKFSRRSFTVAPITTGEYKALKCIFCSREHYNDECTAYKSIAERKKRIAELEICF